MKKFLLAFIFPFVSYSQVQLGNDIDGEALNDNFGQSVAISSSGTRVVIGANLNDANSLNNSGHCRVYDLINGNWVQVGQDIDGTQLMEQSGYSVDISGDGNIIAVGAPRNSGGGPIGDEQRGCVKVYQFDTNSSSWIQIGQNINGVNNDDLSGSSVSLSDNGTVVAIGSPFYNGSAGSNTGLVKIYSFNGTTWSQLGQSISGSNTYDQFGFSISLSSNGDKIAIGANLLDGNGQDSGGVKIYSFNSTSWVQMGQTLIGEYSFDEFGKTVSLSSTGNKLAVGAPFNNGNGDDSGHIRVYEYNGTSWIQVGQDIDGDITNYNLGESVALSSDGTIVCAGAPYYLSGGHAKIFKYQSNNWSQLGTTINTEGDRDLFGTSISITPDGTKLAIGGPYNENNIPNNYTGYVKVYDITTVLKNENFVFNNFSVFPNPAKNIINISLQEGLFIEKIKIYNTLGQLLLTENASQQLNISNLEKGTYFVEVLTNKGKATKSIIVE